MSFSVHQIFYQIFCQIFFWNFVSSYIEYMLFKLFVLEQTYTYIYVWHVKSFRVQTKSIINLCIKCEVFSSLNNKKPFSCYN